MIDRHEETRKWWAAIQKATWAMTDEVAAGLELDALPERQRRKVAQVIQQVLEHCWGPEPESRPDVKEIELRQVGDCRWRSLWMVVGKKDDEGTMLQLVARRHVHVTIGPRGGVHKTGKRNGPRGWDAVRACLAEK